MEVTRAEDNVIVGIGMNTTKKAAVEREARAVLPWPRWGEPAGDGFEPA